MVSHQILVLRHETGSSCNFKRQAAIYTRYVILNISVSDVGVRARSSLLAALITFIVHAVTWPLKLVPCAVLAIHMFCDVYAMCVL